MKNFSTETTTILNKRHSIGLSIYVKIFWQSGTIMYSDKDLGLSYKSVILSVSSVSNSISENLRTSTSSVSIDFDDSSGELKSLLNTETVEGTLATVYFVPIDTNGTPNIHDDNILIQGRISGDITWSEGERIVSFDIESFTLSEEVGATPTIIDVPNLSPDSENDEWPLCFGQINKVESKLLFGETFEGKTINDIYNTTNSFSISSLRLPPQDVEVIIQVDKLRLRGTFSERVFTITEDNVPVFENLAIAERPTDSIFKNNHNVLWLDGPENIEGQYCLIELVSGKYVLNYCNYQIDNECHFSNDWFVNNFGALLDESNVIAETSFFAYSIVPFRTSIVTFGGVETYWKEYFSTWRIPHQTDVLIISEMNYICNQVPSTEVYGVYSYISKDGEKFLAKVPESYYSVTLDRTITYKGEDLHVTTIDFDWPLESYINQSWSGDVYVSLESTLGSNTADQIKYLLDTYTNLTTDTTTFAAVANQITKYPSHFALTKRQDALAIAQEMAWQARCALYFRGTTVYIKYLVQGPSFISKASIDETQVEIKSLVTSYTSIEQVITKINSTYNRHYAGEIKSDGDKEGQRELIYENNLSIFGLAEQDFDFYIYHSPALVSISLAFWGYRFSNIWRKMQYNSFIKYLKLEVLDEIYTSIVDYSANRLAGYIEEIEYNVDDYNVSITVQTDSKSGVIDSGNNPIDDNTFWYGATSQFGSLIFDPAGNIMPPGYIVNSEGGIDVVSGYLDYLNEIYLKDVEYDSSSWEIIEPKLSDDFDLIDSTPGTPRQIIHTFTTKYTDPTRYGVKVFNTDSTISPFGVGQIVGSRTITDDDGEEIKINEIAIPNAKGLGVNDIMFSVINYVRSSSIGYMFNANSSTGIVCEVMEADAQVGDIVGTVPNYSQLSKYSHGFKIIALDGFKAAIVPTGDTRPINSINDSSSQVVSKTIHEILETTEQSPLSVTFKAVSEDNLDPAKLIVVETSNATGEGWGVNCSKENLRIKYDPASGTPIAGTNVGTKAGTDKLHVGQTGFAVVGVDEPNNEVIVTPSYSASTALGTIVYNAGTTTIPQYGAMEIVGWSGNTAVVDRPSEDNIQPGLILYNQSDPILAGENGVGINSFDSNVIFLSIDSLSIGDEVGTQANSYYLSSSKLGFVVLEGGVKPRCRPFRIMATGAHIFGGQTIADCSSYSIKGNRWKEATELPFARFGSGSFTIDLKANVVGGSIDFYNDGSLKDNEQYSPNTKSWSSKVDLPANRTEFSGAGINNKGYVFTGGSSSKYGANHLSDTQEYVSDAWTQKADIPLTSRRGARNGVVDVKAYVIGGMTLTTKATNDEYNSLLDTFITKAPIPDDYDGQGADITEAAITAIDNTVYVFGGYQSPGYVIREESRAYDSLLNTWSHKISNPRANWAGNRGAIATTTEGYAYQFGGNRYGVDLVETDRYNPAGFGTWTTLSDILPPGRFRHTGTNIESTVI